jgi:heterodisulfide reductase subunit A
MGWLRRDRMEEKGDRIGVYVCECGPNIAESIDIDKVIEAIAPLDSVVVADRYKLLCSGDGQKFLEEKIKEENLTHLVVAACSPKQHEITFMTVCEKAGINPYLFQLANIREQCAWIIEDKKEATQKAIRHIKAAIKRVHHHSPLEKKEVESNSNVLVIGGGLAGLESSLMLAGPKRIVYLVEKTATLGGAIRQFKQVYPSMTTSASLIDSKVQAIEDNEFIEVFTNTEVEYVLGFFGNFEVKLINNSQENEEAENEFKVGAVIVATGYNTFNPTKLTNYGYNKYDNILTGTEFEKMNSDENILLKNGQPPKSVGIVHCVGRSEKGYCSEVCCLYSLKFARILKEQYPDINITHFYSDLCVPGKSYQKYFEDVKNKGIEFVRVVDPDANIEVTEKSGEGLNLEYKTEIGSENNNTFDMIILAPAMEPGIDTKKLAEMLNIPVGEKGFFQEQHEKIGPVATSIDGIYIAGCAHGPKNLSETVTQSVAAAGKILSSLIPGKKIEPEVKTSEISESLCTGCKTCLSVCCYSAITFDELKKVSVVNEVICRGCGNCVAACPSDAISLKGFTDTQIYNEVMEAVN